VPVSKSKRDTYVPPPKPKPKPSPRYVPITGTALIVVGIAVVLLTYLAPGLLPGGNIPIIVGFVLMAVGLGFLSRWR
jgi:hypothetical protein